MKKIVKAILLTLALQVFCLSHAVVAGPVQSNTQFSMSISIFVEKMEKITAYANEIKETTQLINSVGELDMNAARELIAKGAGYMEAFQNSVYFGTVTDAFGKTMDKLGIDARAVKANFDAARDLARDTGASMKDTFSDIAVTVNETRDTIKDVREQVDSVRDTMQDARDTIQDAQDTARDVKDFTSTIGQTVQDVFDENKTYVQGGVNSATKQALSDTQQAVAGSVNNVLKGAENAQPNANGETNIVAAAGNTNTPTQQASIQQTTSSQAAQTPSQQKTMYGLPQQSIEDAQKYVKDTFFYSIKEGDKPDGAPLPNTTDAQKKVSANRLAYYEEVISSSYGQALEASSTTFEESKKRWEDLNKKLSSAKTYDDKKAVEVAITQNDIRERMQRLALELGALELEATTLLYREPEQYIIARSAEEIQAEVKAKLDATNLQKEN